MQAFENFGSRSQFLNLGRVLRQTAWVNPDGIALVCGDEHLSFEELDRSTDALARCLLRTGLESGVALQFIGATLSRWFSFTLRASRQA